MKRRTTWMALLLGTALLAVGGTGVAQAQQFGGPRTNYQDRGQYREQMRGMFAPNLEGRWREQATNGRNGQDFGQNDPNGGRRMLPSFLQIDQNRGQVLIQDFRGRTLQTIQVAGRQRWNQNPDVLMGQYRGGALEVHRTTPSGAQITRTFSVQNRGRTLVIHTQIDNGRSGRNLEFDRVYHRA